MLSISNSDVNPGRVETQQLRIMYPPGVSHYFCFHSSSKGHTSPN